MAKVFIVEDSKLVVTMMKKHLAPDGHEFTIATNGEEALEILSSGVLPDIIILDIVMEGMDGFELIEKIKTNDQTKSIPVLFCTSLDKGSDINRGIELGANDYIIKPFTPNEIRNKITDNLRN
ncbi:MAG: response regulator [Cyanobacteriota bacterium]